MNLGDYKKELRNFPGITRKNFIHHVIEHFPDLPLPVDSGRILASWGEDAAVLDLNEKQLLLFAADGIMKKLIDADPFWAGYCSVLVNIHDIIAMGGTPIGMVNTISFSDRSIAEELLEGIQFAVEKFKVPMVGGHTHPDSDWDSVSVAILGIAEREQVIYSHTAVANDEIIAALDLEGETHKSFEFSWDTTRKKSTEDLFKQFDSIKTLARKGIATSGKDISNPGLIGTVGMMAECGGNGAVIDLDSIPKPENLDFIRWLKMYQGMGFVITVKQDNAKEALDILNSGGLSAEKIGWITDSNKLTITQGNKSVDVFDFSVDSITGVKPDSNKS